MFTAMQSAHLYRANALHEARTKLFGCIALICTDASDRQRIYTAIEAIDLMLAGSVPNGAIETGLEVSPLDGVARRHPGRA